MRLKIRNPPWKWSFTFTSSRDTIFKYNLILIKVMSKSNPLLDGIPCEQCSVKIFLCGLWKCGMHTLHSHGRMSSDKLFQSSSNKQFIFMLISYYVRCVLHQQNTWCTSTVRVASGENKFWLINTYYIIPQSTGCIRNQVSRKLNYRLYRISLGCKWGHDQQLSTVIGV